MTRTLLLKITLLLSFLLQVIWLPAQQRAINFNAIDWAVQNIDASTPEAPSQQLTAPYQTDLEKVRAIFRWITEHVAYAMPQRATLSRSALRYKPLDSAVSLKSADEIIAHTVLQNRTAVCNGYARLFKTLCGYAGIRAELVTGYARGGWGNPKFRSNHTWNAVYVDSAWHLLDATWASGFITWSDQFVKQYDDAFFFPDPQQFIYTHYPEDLRWALLLNPPTLREFYQAPFRPTAFVKYNIASYAPASGVVEAAVGDTLQFRLELKGRSDFDMVAEPESDSMLRNPLPNWDFITPTIAGNQVLFTYVVPSPDVEWLHLVFNNDVILRYRLNVRKRGS